MWVNWCGRCLVLLSELKYLSVSPMRVDLFTLDVYVTEQVIMYTMSTDLTGLLIYCLFARTLFIWPKEKGYNDLICQQESDQIITYMCLFISGHLGEVCLFKLKQILMLSVQQKIFLLHNVMFLTCQLVSLLLSNLLQQWTQFSKCGGGFIVVPL